MFPKVLTPADLPRFSLVDRNWAPPPLPPPQICPRLTTMPLVVMATAPPPLVVMATPALLLTKTKLPQWPQERLGPSTSPPPPRWDISTFLILRKKSRAPDVQTESNYKMWRDHTDYIQPIPLTSPPSPIWLWGIVLKLMWIELGPPRGFLKSLSYHQVIHCLRAIYCSFVEIIKRAIIVTFERKFKNPHNGPSSIHISFKTIPHMTKSGIGLGCRWEYHRFSLHIL